MRSLTSSIGFVERRNASEASAGHVFAVSRVAYIFFIAGGGCPDYRSEASHPHFSKGISISQLGLGWAATPATYDTL